MTDIGKKVKCKMSGRKISTISKLLHKINCSPKTHNIIVKHFTKNYNTITNPDISFNRPNIKTNNFNSDKGRITLNEDNTNRLNTNAIIGNTLNNINLNNNTQNEELLNMEGIQNARNIESNDNRIENLEENFYFSYSNFYFNSNHPVDKDIIDRLNINFINENMLPNIDGEKCMICLEDYQNGEKYISLPCIHRFHDQCILDWFRQNKNCPICKFVLTRKNIFTGTNLN